ncbi:MAG TPA: CHAT domain-containing tetratricopeptide repeat protein [Bryobacteraceae bacterium]|nr:CHAT domain-containing tetratricopeptide repeat protein [Bryobacteraceae bacterium]
MLSVLCCGHVGLLCAAPSQQPPSIKAKIETLIEEGKQQKHDGHFAAALGIFSNAGRIAHQNHDAGLEAKALALSAGCQIGLFRYRQALAQANEALELAVQVKDDTVAGAAAGNLATVYAQLGDFANAGRRAGQSVTFLRHSNRKDWLAKALLNSGDIEAQQGQADPASRAYFESIQIARDAHMADAEAMAELHLGESLLDADRLQEARRVLLKAVQLLRQTKDDDLAIAQADIAELDFKEKKYAEGLYMLDRALASHHLLSVSPYVPTHLRGEILLALGRQWDALAEFRKAANQASKWRQGALPGDATSLRTVSYLHSIYQDFTELAASLALKTYNTALAREAIEVLADNRAASLREQIAVALDRKGALPPEYFQLLSELQSAQAYETLSPTRESQAKVEQIRLQVSEQENKFGINSENFFDKAEKISSRKSLRNIQRGLGGSELLLSFCLGKDKSFLWAITNEQVKLYELPPEAKLTMHAEAFSEAVHRGPSAVNAGRALSSDLFSHLDRNFLQRPDWVIVGDGALLNSVPFSALPEPSGSGYTYLAVNHRVRFLPSEALLGGSSSPVMPQPEFIGIADPIYNLADSRRSRSQLFVKAAHSEGFVALARLVGSDREVREAAKMSGLPVSQFLTGVKATGAELRNALSSKPEVIHFAVHVVSPDGKPEEAALALSLTDDDLPEMLTPETISAYRVPGSLVVLSGCSSQQGKTLPGAGLIGLSRAWLLAGASAVVVSAWPTPDDSGHFFSAFYSHLETKTLTSRSLASRAAAALQLAQTDMQRGGGYRSSPAFWAAYSIISKE